MIINNFKCLFLCLFVFSCGLQSKHEESKKNYDGLHLYSNTHNIGEDSLLVKVFIDLPTSNLVFVKKGNKFEALVEVSLRVEDNNTGIQIKRISNENKIVKEYYEDTRSSDLYRVNYSFLLKKNDYKITANIKDLDSFNVWGSSSKINAKNQVLVLFYYPKKQKIKEYIGRSPIKKIDTLWMEIPKNQFNINDYKYIIYKKDNILNDGYIENCRENIFSDLFFECPILIDDNIFGDIKIEVTSKNLNKIFSSNLSMHEDTTLWSSDIDAILGVMSYILSYSDIRTLYKMPEEDQLTFVLEYIKNQDLDLTTNKNEFLELIKKRFQYVNSNFSQFNIGWRTDRGEVYIVNGPPKSIDSLYDNVNMVNKEIWYYENQTFIFSDERTFGELKLSNGF